jgi:hypothetical protein
MKQPDDSRKSPRKSKSREKVSRSAKSADPSRPSQEQRPRIGLEAAIEKLIPREWTLAHYHPQLPAVLSTPAMIGMMEIAAAGGAARGSDYRGNAN